MHDAGREGQVTHGDGTGGTSIASHVPGWRAWVFAGLLAVHLTVAGLVRFDLFTSDAWEIALQWGAIVGGAAWAWLVLRARGPRPERRSGFEHIFRASLILAVTSALVLFALILTVSCQAHEVERYVRALMLSVTVYLFANAAIAFALIALVYVLCGRLWTSTWIGVAILALLHGIHVAKYLILQQHLYPWDYVLTADLIEILPVWLGSGGVIAALAGGALALLVTGLMLWREKPRESPGKRVGLWIGSTLTVLALLALLLLGAAGRDPALNDYYPLWNRQSYNAHHNKSGFCFALLRGTRHMWVNRAPDGYSAEAMADIARKYPAGRNEVAPTADVILYMVESLEDLAAYGLHHREDPISNFHALAADHAGGRLVVPTYGGSTSNTEFEVLTGLSRIQPWPRHMVHAYRQWISEDTPSLAWVFRAWGYHTAVVSGATGKYFAQETAYPRLGFEAFRALGDRDGVPQQFDLVSDDAVVDEVIAILGSASSAPTGRRPCFISVTTDATHAPYAPERVPPDERFALTDDDLPEAVRSFACGYGTALHHADQALGRLVAFLEARGEPAVLVVYGDHKAVMGALFAAGIFRSEWPGAVIDKYSTPLAIWSNVPAGGRGEPLFLSANFLGVELLERLGVRHMPSTFRYTQAVYEKFAVVSHVIASRDGGFRQAADLPADLAEVLRDYGLVKYHVLVGSRGK